MKHLVRLVGALVVVAGAFIVVPMASASAATYPCGGFQHHTATVAFTNGTVNLFRSETTKGTEWCAYTARTGSYKAVAGATAVDERVNGKDTSNIDLGNYKYYAGPIFWSGNCGQAYGATGNSKGLLYAASTKKYCVSSTK